MVFHDPSLLEQALMHSSYLNENPAAGLSSNERLEFLGDAVLGMVMAEKLYHDLPGADEGQLTAMRSGLVRGQTLAEIARSVALGDYLFMGKGEEARGGRNNESNLSGALEALIAAVYLDSGFGKARDFILRLFGEDVQEAAHQPARTNYKSQLQELTQLHGASSPTYHVIDAVGPDHDRTFTIEVRLGDRALARGQGKSKKAAETEAARLALAELTKNT